MISDFSKLDLSRLPGSCFVVDEVAIARNADVLNAVAKQSGAKVLMALKAFSMWSLADLVKEKISGTCASGLHELQLGHDYYGGECHVFSAAYDPADMARILQLADTVVFNSIGQWQRFQKQVLAAVKERPKLKLGLRINPEHSEGAVPIYDPCAPGSRLGIPLAQLQGADLSGISGLHFHTLCEQDFLPLKRTLAVVEEKFAQWLPKMDWINFGGGHHITAENYQREQLVETIQLFSKRHDVQVYLEPGEAFAIGTGVLVTTVLDVVDGDIPKAILNTSATCHMPDTLEMPYRADIMGAGEKGEYPYTYRLGGMTCLAGDVMGDYSFPEPLKVGQKLLFLDMAHYTMVKTTTFNGTKLPAIVRWNSKTGKSQVVKQFGYEDFKNRLS